MIDRNMADEGPIDDISVNTFFCRRPFRSLGREQFRRGDAAAEDAAVLRLQFRKIETQEGEKRFFGTLRQPALAERRRVGVELGVRMGVGVASPAKTP